MITLLVPTRGRPELCKRMIESARNTSSTQLEIILGIGGTDSEYFYKENHYGYDIGLADQTCFMGELPAVYTINHIARYAHGDLLYVVGDDTIFETKGWDNALIEHYRNLNNKIHVYSLLDSRGENGTPHPVITRGFMKAMGYVYPPIFFHFYVDTWVVEMAKANCCFTHLKDYMLRHDKPSDKGIFDETFTRVRSNGWGARDEEVHKICGHFLEVEKQRLASHIGISNGLYEHSGIDNYKAMGMTL